MTESDVETALQTAASYIGEVAQEVPEFRETVRGQSDYVRQEDTGLLAAIRSRFQLRGTKQTLLSNLEKADEEISRAQNIDPSATLVSNEADGTETILSIPELRAWRHYTAARVHIQDNNLKAADQELQAQHSILQRSPSLSPSSLLYMLRGHLYQDLNRPRAAFEMYRKAEEADPDAHDPNNESAIEARKERQRLESKKVFSRYWFVGSRKVAAVLIGLTILTLIGLFTNPEPGAFSAVLLVSGITAVYFWRKLK